LSSLRLRSARYPRSLPGVRCAGKLNDVMYCANDVDKTAREVSTSRTPGPLFVRAAIIAIQT
jgi:hypothetical protein